MGRGRLKCNWAVKLILFLYRLRERYFLAFLKELDAVNSLWENGVFILQSIAKLNMKFGYKSSFVGLFIIIIILIKRMGHMRELYRLRTQHHLTVSAWRLRGQFVVYVLSWPYTTSQWLCGVPKRNHCGHINRERRNN